MKVCSKCGVEKDESEFYKAKRYLNGVMSICKHCSREKHREWCKNNPEKVKEYAKEWGKNNAEKVKGYSKKFRKNNTEKAKEYGKEWRVDNHERRKEYASEQVFKLTDAYTKQCLVQSGWNRQSIPHEVIEVKRQLIKLRRKIKNRQQPNKK